MRAVLSLMKGAGRFGVAAQAALRTRNLNNNFVYRVCQIDQVRSYDAKIDHHQELTPREEEENNNNTYDFQPSADGPWEEGYKEQQSRYNKQLAAGVAVFAVSALVGQLATDGWMYATFENPKEWYSNPPPFTMKALEEEALAKLEGEEEC